MNSAFNLSFGNDYKPLHDKIRDHRRRVLENLVFLIIDEISMVKADMLYQLDLRFRELKQEPNLPFGGVAVFLFGDIMQLRPVQARYIFEQPSNTVYHISFHTAESL